MLEPPTIRAVAARPTAVVRLTVPRSAIREVMGPALAEVRAVLEAQGIAPAGPWFTHHLRVDPGTFDVEVGVPVAAAVAVAASGRVAPGDRPASEVARADYRGPYEGLGAAWGELTAWIAAQGRTPGPDLWETDAVGPESSPDPADWRTELERPLAAPPAAS